MKATTSSPQPDLFAGEESPRALPVTTGLRRIRRSELAIRRRLFAPPPKLTLSEWADRYRMLSRGASAEPGKWRTSRAPYQRGVMDAISDPQVERVALMWSAQVGKTEILLNGIGFYVDQDPAPMLVLQPNVKPMADAFSKDRLAPMLRDSPRLRGKVRNEGGRRQSEDTILHKVFPGGHITVAGANSAAGLASRPIRVLFADEIDRYPASAGSEGDPLTLAAKRTATFWNRKIVAVSSPTVKGISRIEQAFDEGDQRRFQIPCLKCGTFQPLRWAHLKFEPLGYECAKCNRLIDEIEKPRMMLEGTWIAAKPENAYPSFHLNALYSSWATWAELRDEFLTAKKSPERLQVFVNTVLAESWEAAGEKQTDAAVLGQRRETYAAEVPDEVGLLTAGVDVQADRLELLVWGWGAAQESWIIRHYRLLGDPETAAPWKQLDEQLLREWPHAAGGALRIRCTLIDSGAFTNPVYLFVRERQRRGVFASKGLSQRGRALVNRPGRPNRHGVRVVPLGVDTAKDALFGRLKLGTPGSAGYVHIPQHADDAFLEQFAAEVVRIRHHKGVPVREYHKVRERNEAIDLAVLNLAALHLLGPATYDQLAALVTRVRAHGAQVKAAGEKAPPPDDGPPAQLPPVQPTRGPRPPGRGWVNRW